ncbi:MAG: hypothetical protein QME51_07650, partial [Planctomycetota bacterium]|nr:hypothetical protein [Planctomycetota bacterium]
MCGICGRVNFDNQPVSADLLHRMCEVMKHRGPDSEGIYPASCVLRPASNAQRTTDNAQRIGLGIRRLAIIDLKTGDQPI